MICNLSGNLPSSFLDAAFGERLLTPRNTLQKLICVFSIVSFSQVVFSFLSYAPHTSELCVSIGRNKASKSLLQTLIDNLEGSR